MISEYKVFLELLIGNTFKCGDFRAILYSDSYEILFLKKIRFLIVLSLLEKGFLKLYARINL